MNMLRRKIWIMSLQTVHVRTIPILAMPLKHPQAISGLWDMTWHDHGLKTTPSSCLSWDSFLESSISYDDRKDWGCDDTWAWFWRSLHMSLWIMSLSRHSYVVMLPFLGKSSVINTLKRKTVCKAAPVPGETRVWQYIALTRTQRDAERRRLSPKHRATKTSHEISWWDIMTSG